MKPIADAADGFDEVTGLPEFLPQALDVDIDGALEHDRVLADRGIHQLVAGTDRLIDQPKLCSDNSLGISANRVARHLPTDICHNDPGLAAVVDAWPDLPEAIKAGIVAMVKAARS
jgi:hypothetical protein